MRDDAALLEEAIAVACRAHRGQRYPSPEREPYIQHSLRVMLAVHSFRTQMVAVLHDVLEDTAVTVGDLRAAGLPGEVVAAVVAMTHRPEHTYEEYIEQVAGDPLACQVKLADLADNLANNRRLARTPDVVGRIDRYEQAIRRLRSEIGPGPNRSP
jgi:(p)ppGpp synthase/HD superfamily hydrolase